MIAAVTGVAGGAPRTEAGEGRLGWCAAEPLTRLACDRGHDGSAQASTENLTPLPPGPPPLTHRVWAGCEVREVRADGPRPSYAFESKCPESDLSVLGVVCQPSPPPHVFAPSFSPTETPIPGPSADAQVGPRLPLGERASPPHHTGHHASLAPTDKPALTRPVRPVSRATPADVPGRASVPCSGTQTANAPNLSIGKGGGIELSVERPHPGQQALVRAAQRQLAERREQGSSFPLTRRRDVWDTPALRDRPAELVQGVRLSAWVAGLVVVVGPGCSPGRHDRVVYVKLCNFRFMAEGVIG